MSQITFSSYREPNPSPETISLPENLNEKASVIALQAIKTPKATTDRPTTLNQRTFRLARENTTPLNNQPKSNPKPPETKTIDNTQYTVIQSDNGSAKLLLDEDKFQNIQDQYSLIQNTGAVGMDDPLIARLNCSFATAEENGKKVGFASIAPVKEEGAISRMIKKIKHYGEDPCQCQTITVAANEPQELTREELNSIRSQGFSVTSNKSALAKTADVKSISYIFVWEKPTWDNLPERVYRYLHKKDMSDKIETTEQTPDFINLVRPEFVKEKSLLQAIWDRLFK